MNWFAIGGVVAVVFYGFVLAVAFRKPMAEAIRQLMSLKRATLVALGALAIVASVNAQKPGGTNDTNNAGMDLGDDGGTNMMMMAGRSILRKSSLPVSEASSLLIRNAPLRSGAPSTTPTFTVTAEDIARGYKQIAETNDYNYSYAMPEGAIEIANIFAHGARSEFGLRVVDLTEFTFRLGTNDTSYSRFWLTLDGMLKTGIRTPFPFIAAGPGVGDALAVQGESRIWTKFVDNKHVITWQNMHPGGDTNITDNYQISLATGGNFETRSNEVCRAFEYVPWNDYDNDGLINDLDPNPTNYWYGIAAGSTTFSVPPVIMRGGNLGMIHVSYDPPLVFDNLTASLTCSDPNSRVLFWEDEDKTTPMTFPVTLGAGEISSFYVEGISASTSLNDVEFTLQATAGTDTCTLTRSLTVACVESMTMTGPGEGMSTNPPPFIGETQCPFSITNSLFPAKHFLVPYHEVATLTTNGFELTNFTVTAQLNLSPSGVDASHLSAEWEMIEALPQMSGSFSAAGGLSAQLVNPTQGGVYQIRGRVNGSPWTKGNILLPVSGAEIDTYYENDMVLASNVVNRLLASTDEEKRQKPEFLLKWFWGAGCGDYHGRADNADNPTTWIYNQVTDDDGFGAVATLYGVPTRMAKLSNLIVGYATERLGVSDEYQELGQEFGTINDRTADYSWHIGTVLASGCNVHDTSVGMAKDMWGYADSKPRKLWPNPNTADNYIISEAGYNFNYHFSSPSMFIRAEHTFGGILDIPNNNKQ